MTGSRDGSRDPNCFTDIGLNHSKCAGLDVPEGERPRPSKKQRPDPRVATATDFVDSCMRAYCERYELSPSIVCNRSDLERFVGSFLAGSIEETSEPLLQGWRGEIIGQKLLEVLRGKTAVSLDPETVTPVFHDL